MEGRHEESSPPFSFLLSYLACDDEAEYNFTRTEHEVEGTCRNQRWLCECVERILDMVSENLTSALLLPLVSVQQPLDVVLFSLDRGLGFDSPSSATISTARPLSNPELSTYVWHSLGLRPLLHSIPYHDLSSKKLPAKRDVGDGGPGVQAALLALSGVCSVNPAALLMHAIKAVVDTTDRSIEGSGFHQYLCDPLISHRQLIADLACTAHIVARTKADPIPVTKPSSQGVALSDVKGSGFSVLLNGKCFSTAFVAASPGMQAFSPVFENPDTTSVLQTQALYGVFEPDH